MNRRDVLVTGLAGVAAAPGIMLAATEDACAGVAPLSARPNLRHVVTLPTHSAVAAMTAFRDKLYITTESGELFELTADELS